MPIWRGDVTSSRLGLVREGVGLDGIGQMGVDRGDGF